MNKCHVLKDLSSYLDNQLAGDRRPHVENHLKECATCSEELSRLKKLSEQLKAWQVPELGSSFDNSVRNKIVLQELEKGEIKMKKKTLAILIPSSALAGILVIAFLGVLFRPGHIMQINNDMIRKGRMSQLDARSLYERAEVSRGVLAKARSPYGGTMADMAGGTEGALGGVSYQSTKGMMKGGSKSDRYYYANAVVTEAAPTALAIRDVEQDFVSAGYGEGPIIVIQPTMPATGEGDKIIRTAEVKLEVEDGKDTYNKASVICQELGGYMAASRFYKDREDRESGTIIMRIPKDKFLTAVDKLSALGKVDNIDTNSQDVAQEYANLKARLDAAMVVYNKTLEALQKKQVTISEAARLESELTPVLQRVQELKNQIEYLNNAVSFTTITVNFHEPAVSVKALKESSRYLKQGLYTAAIDAVKFLAKAIPVVIVTVVLLAVALAAVLILKAWIIRLFKRG